MTAAEIRQRILEVVLKNGGHLSSSLGAVELAMALRQVFDPETDRVLWDVGHQAYAWKLLTGRDARFDSLRQLNGLAPFLTPAESKADAAVSGHAGSALSVAMGLAAARDRRGTGEHVIAVVGDSSLANGVSFEALNNCATTTRRLIVVLNDNDMSISRPAGSLARFLGRLTSGIRYNRAKNAAKRAGRMMRLSFLYGFVHWAKHRLKTLVLGNVYFEQFGFHYLGPVDGHDLKALVSALTAAKEENRPVLIHAVTRKGRGYAPAEMDPTRYHGVGAGGVTEKPVYDAIHRRPDWSTVFGALLTEAARADPRVVALTAGMKDGTGLADFAKEFPTRFFDVGIAEEHMLSFAAGLAAGGLRPFVCVYSTFLQRALDQLVHDVAISRLPVVLCVDRAGVVGADGATHQGLYDLAMTRCVPGLTVAQPCDGLELKLMIEAALKRGGPTLLRYPRGTSPAPMNVVGEGLAIAVANVSAPVQIWAAGDRLGAALAVAERTGAGVVYARYLKPFDRDLLRRQRTAGARIVSMENACVLGGLGEALGAELRFGWPDEFIPHGKVDELEKRYGQDVESMADRVRRLMDESTGGEGKHG